jgi:5-formyltetrahydrofolate cyclo-ligase
MMNAEKPALRKRMRALLASGGRAEAAAAAEAAEKAALRVLVDMDMWRKADTVLVFVGMKGEFNTDGVIKAALQAGKAVYAPRVEGDAMRFYRIDSTEGPWEISFYGIKEPPPTAQPFDPSGTAGATGATGATSAAGTLLVLSPGLAFDSECRRLGRGKGFYDKFFAALDAAGRVYASCGLGYGCQLVPNVPVEANDKALDAVVLGDRLVLP